MWIASATAVAAFGLLATPPKLRRLTENELTVVQFRPRLSGGFHSRHIDSEHGHPQHKLVGHSGAPSGTRRCIAPQLCASAPGSRDQEATPAHELAPADVVVAQLGALQRDDLESVFAYASPANRRSTGPMWLDFSEMVHQTPAYSVLVGCSEFELTSALSLKPDTWTCRVRVRPSAASLRCHERRAALRVGASVRLTSNRPHLRRAFETCGSYAYDEEMDAMCGKEFEVLAVRPPSGGINIVGLSSPDGSQDGCWYFPVTAFEEAADEKDASGDGGGGDDIGPSPARRIRPSALAFRWELSRQADAQPVHALGQVLAHPSIPPLGRCSHSPPYRPWAGAHTPHHTALGQVLTHRVYGYRGVIIGYDPVCMMPSDWIAQMGVDKLDRGRAQPFYHVLVDTRDRPDEQVTYVAEENVELPVSESLFKGKPPAAGMAVDAVEHPLVRRYLTSLDTARGVYEPVDALKSLYPPNVAGCWMTDVVMPDGPTEW